MGSQHAMAEIEEAMAIRLAYQTILMEGAPKSCTKMADRGLRILPHEWLVVGDEWCADHKLDPMHGAMALLYFKSMYGTGFSTVEIRVILDDAYEMFKGVKWYLG